MNTIFSKNRSIDPLVRRLSEVPGVLAIFLGGSWSTDDGDEYSDIDIGILNESGLLSEDCLAIVRDFANLYSDKTNVNQFEALIWDDDRWPIHVRCASIGEWQEALDVCEADPCAAESYQLEILQTAHFLLPLFDPTGEVHRFKQQARCRPERLWHIHGQKHLQDCIDAVKHLRQFEKLPPLAYALSSPCLLGPVFRTLGAVNQCFYFYGSRMEEYIDEFILKPENARERLMQTYRISPDSEGYVRCNADQADSLTLDISLLLQDLFGMESTVDGQDSAMQRSFAINADNELLSVPSWVRTQDELLLHSRLVADFVYDWPGPLSKYVKRGEFCYFQSLLRGDMISRLVWVILRLNNVETMPLRDLDKVLSQLPVTPINAYDRILEVLLCADPADMLAPLEALARETETVVMVNGL